MSRLNNVSVEQLTKSIESRNYEIVTDIHSKLNLMKGYEVAIKNPKKGIFIINKDGKNYLIEVTPIADEDLSLDDAMTTYGHLFK